MDNYWPRSQKEYTWKYVPIYKEVSWLLFAPIRKWTWDNLSPNMTVLSYLRAKVNKTGYKKKVVGRVTLWCMYGSSGWGGWWTATIQLGELTPFNFRFSTAWQATDHRKKIYKTLWDRSLHPVQKAVTDFSRFTVWIAAHLASSCRCLR